MPRVTVVTRKAYGGAYIAMNARSLGATTVFAWDGAKVAVMGSVAAVRILHRRRLAEVPSEQLAQFEQELADEHDLIAGGLDKATSLGVVDEVIEPNRTRSAVADGDRRRSPGPRPPRQHPPVVRGFRGPRSWMNAAFIRSYWMNAAFIQFGRPELSSQRGVASNLSMQRGVVAKLGGR